MKTALEQLIEHMEYVKDYSAFARDCIIKAKSLLPEERKVIEDAFNDGQRNEFKPKPLHSKQYYQTKFEKK